MRNTALRCGLVIALFFIGCSKDTNSTASVPPALRDSTPSVDPTDTSAVDTSGLCLDPNICKSKPAGPPEFRGDTAYGDVTTYGSTVDPQPSRGGACNYGNTEILNFAAIQVDQLPADAKGQWQGGRACGQCMEVKARTTQGWKTTVVRIVDKCPDGNCGIDLGGAPAKALMVDGPGRYTGQWRLVSCAGQKGVSDGEPTLFVKEGSNSWWSVIQVRNPIAAVQQMRIRKQGASDTTWMALNWATEAENYYKVPKEILQDSSQYQLQISFWGGTAQTMSLYGYDLAKEKANLPLAQNLTTGLTKFRTR